MCPCYITFDSYFIGIQSKTIKCVKSSWLFEEYVYIVKFNIRWVNCPDKKVWIFYSFCHPFTLQKNVQHIEYIKVWIWTFEMTVQGIPSFKYFTMMPSCWKNKIQDQCVPSYQIYLFNVTFTLHNTTKVYIFSHQFLLFCLQSWGLLLCYSGTFKRVNTRWLLYSWVWNIPRLQLL